MSAVLEIEQSLTAAEPIIARSRSAVARILHLSHTLEETRDAFLAILSEADDETIIEVRMSARAVGVWAWLIECACDAEIKHRVPAQKGGRGKKDAEGEGRKAAYGQQAYLDGKSVRTVERNAQIIETFGTETCVMHGASLQDKGFFIAALSAPDPLRAIELFEDEKSENPFFEVQDAWSLVNDLNSKANRQKRKQERQDKPSELIFIHTPEAQAYLAKCDQALLALTAEIPNNVPSLRMLNKRQREQIEWQKTRTVESDYAAILELFTGEGKKGCVQVEYASDSEIWNWLYLTNRMIDEDDLDKYLEVMSQCSRSEQDIARANHKARMDGHVEQVMPAHKLSCTCKPENKQLAMHDQGGKQEERRGDQPDLYMLYGQTTGDSARVARGQSRYDSGERE